MPPQPNAFCGSARFRGHGGNARLFAGGKSAERKANWVIRNGDFVIENIDFLGAQVGDHNCAGIRFEGGDLQFSNCLFLRMRPVNSP